MDRRRTSAVSDEGSGDRSFSIRVLGRALYRGGQVVLGWLFDFRGRIGRARFVAGLSLAILGTGGLLLVTALAAAVLHWRDSTIAVAAFVVFAPLFWSILALEVKRLRDIGLPVLLLPAVIVLNFADHFLAVRTGWRFLWPDDPSSPVSGVVNVALLFALLAWPGRPVDEPARGAPATRKRTWIVLGSAAACAFAVVAAGLAIDPWNGPGCPTAIAKGADCSRAGAVGRYYSTVLGIRANKALDRKRPDDALRDLDRLIAIRPNAVFAWNSRGIAHDQRGELRAALADYDHALALVPGYANALTNRATVQKELGSAAGPAFAPAAAAPVKAALVQAAPPAQPEPEEPPIVTVANGPARASIIRDFQDDLRTAKSDGRVRDCRLAIDYVSAAPAGKDTSWGAVCTVEQGSREQDVMACDDRLLGKFTMRYQFTESWPALIDFVGRNCPPGG
jgi:uncharacterized membrane protein YhaH (DUF805 family)